MIQKNIMILFTLMPYLLLAQGDWKIGVVASPDICYRVMHFKTPQYQSDYDSINTDYARPGFRIGITSTYNFSEQLELEFGLLYAEQNLKRNNPVKDSLIDHISFLMNTHYLVIPVKANIILGDEDFGFIGTVGLSFGYGYHMQERYTIYDSTNTELGHSVFQDNSYPDFMMCAELGAGIHYLISDMFEFRAMPTFRYMLNSGYNGSQYKFTPFTAGLSCSLLWRI